MTPKAAVACQSCAAKDKYAQQTLMYQFVMGLRSEFEPIRTQLLNYPTPPTLTAALSSLIAEETRLHSLMPASGSSPHAVLSLSQRFGSTRATPTGVLVCSHCKRTGHLVDKCFKLHPDQLIAYRARQPFDRHRGAPTGPSRARTGAVTADTSTSTVTSGSVSAMTSVAPSASSAAHPWVLDSGASFHVTSDSSQLAEGRPNWRLR